MLTARVRLPAPSWRHNPRGVNSAALGSAIGAITSSSTTNAIRKVSFFFKEKVGIRRKMKKNRKEKQGEKEEKEEQARAGNKMRPKWFQLDANGHTDGRTDPHIEMRGNI